MTLESFIASFATAATVAGFVSYLFKSIFEVKLKESAEKKIAEIHHKAEQELEKFRNNKALELEDIHNQNQREMEKLKTHLEIYKQLAIHDEEKKRDVYANIVGLIYRLRNMARDLNHHINDGNLSLLDEFDYRKNEFEELIIKHRKILEADAVMKLVHRYKNLLINYRLIYCDIVFFLNQHEMSEVTDLIQHLRSSYREIEINHKKLIDLLSRPTNFDQKDLT